MNEVRTAEVIGFPKIITSSAFGKAGGVVPSNKHHVGVHKAWLDGRGTSLGTIFKIARDSCPRTLRWGRYVSVALLRAIAPKMMQVLGALLFGPGLIMTVFAAGVGSDATNETKPGAALPFKNANLPVEQRVNDLLGRMTLEEKIALIVIDPSTGTGLDTVQNLRLGIPRLSLTDGPMGASFSRYFGKGATCFPAGICMASTWNEGLLEKAGVAIAEETLAEGRNVILGPCINIQRTPLNGRNFESFSEDPYLTARMAVQYVKGVQSRHVIACPKHFACNNFEWYRMYNDVRVDDRTLHEIYLPAFKAAVQEGGAWSVMGAYNQLNGAYCCSSKVLLTEILKREWGFQGIVISDWGAVHSTGDTALAGLDLEGGSALPFMGAPLLEAVKKGEIPEEAVTDKARRILRVTMLSGIFDTPWVPRYDAKEINKQPEPTGVFNKSMYNNPLHQDEALLDSPAHRALALEIAREGIILLKNEGRVLPFNHKNIRSLAVIGPNAVITALGGGGAGEVKPVYSISPLEGILKRVGNNVQVRYAQGCDFDQRYNIPLVQRSCFTPPDGKPGDHGLRGEYFNNRNLEGSPVLTRKDDLIFFHWVQKPPAPEVDNGNFSVRWTGKLKPPHTGRFKIYALRHGAFYGNEQGDGVRVYIEGKLVIDNWVPERFGPRPAIVDLDASKSYDLRYEYHCAGPGRQPIAILGWIPYDKNPIDEAAQVAKSCDAAVVVVGYNQYYEGENNDRGGMHLPGDQDALITAVRNSNKNTVVVLYNGGPVLMKNWVDRVAAILEAGYPGQEGGAALADILFGEVNPSGKLTDTFGKTREDYPDCGNYPGDGKTVKYTEGIYVGYRHFEKRGIKPEFAFGHGLSYTSFRYFDLKINPSKVAPDKAVKVELSIANTGGRDGAEVVQLYVHDMASSVDRPIKELKGFRKVYLKSGESRKVTMNLDKSAFAYYDPALSQWVAEPGDFDILIGSSSNDIRLKGRLTLQ